MLKFLKLRKRMPAESTVSLHFNNVECHLPEHTTLRCVIAAIFILNNTENLLHTCYIGPEQHEQCSAVPWEFIVVKRVS
jgi:hypothetical protein